MCVQKVGSSNTVQSSIVVRIGSWDSTNHNHYERFWSLLTDRANRTDHTPQDRRQESFSGPRRERRHVVDFDPEPTGRLTRNRHQNPQTLEVPTVLK